MKITPTLNFGGQCREAIHAYAEAFGGTVACLITYRDANDPAYLPLLREDQRDWVYHAELLLDGQRIIMSDHADIAFTTCYSNFLTLMFDTKEEVHRAWAAIREGSTIIYPLEATRYSAARVVFVDRFGIRWGLMTEARE